MLTFQPRVDPLESRDVPAIVTSELSIALWENTPTPGLVAIGCFTYDDAAVDPNEAVQSIAVSALSFTLAGQTFTHADISGTAVAIYKYGQLDGVHFTIPGTPGGYPYQQIHVAGGHAHFVPIGGGAIPVPVDYIDRTTLADPAGSHVTTSFRNGEHNYRIHLILTTTTGQKYTVAYDLAATSGPNAREQLLSYLRDSGWDARAIGTDGLKIYGKSTGGGTGLQPIAQLTLKMTGVQNDTPGILVGGTADVVVDGVERKK